MTYTFAGGNGEEIFVPGDGDGDLLPDNFQPAFQAIKWGGGTETASNTGRSGTTKARQPGMIVGNSSVYPSVVITDCEA